MKPRRCWGEALKGLHAGRLGNGHQAHVWARTVTTPAEGWVYFAPTSNAEGVWDLWWIGVAPDCQRRGIGDALLRFVENHVLSAGGRLLLIETSSLLAFDPVRRFYAKRGYAACGRMRRRSAVATDRFIMMEPDANRALHRKYRQRPCSPVDVSSSPLVNSQVASACA
jgi:GNAT superfamily N-acetyltransferase